MTIEIRLIVNGVEYTIDEAYRLLDALEKTLLRVDPQVDEKPRYGEKRNPTSKLSEPAADAPAHDIHFDPRDSVWKNLPAAIVGSETAPDEEEASKHCCTMCGEPGHNRRTCPTKRIVHCSICGEQGHNKQTCQAERKVSNFAGWNAYMKNPDNHLRFVRGKRKGHLNLKRMGEAYRLLKYGSSKKRER